MQPASPPDDLQAILSRFHTWAERHPANGHGKGPANGAPAEEIREIPYEEAIRRHRSLEAARTPRRATSSKTKAEAGSQPRPTHNPAPTAPEASDELPLWAANLPIVPDSEPVIDLATAPSPEPPAPSLPEAVTRMFVPAPAPQRVRKPAREPRPDPVPAALAAALLSQAAAVPAPPLRPSVHLPPAPAPSRPRPQRRSAPPAPPSKSVASVEAPPRRAPAAATPQSRSAQHALPTLPAAAVSNSARPTPPASRTARPAKSIRPTIPPGLIGSPIRAAAKTVAPKRVLRSSLPAVAAKPKPRAPRAPQFSQVLASTLQQPKAALAPNKKGEPDRTRRITTRFSASEQRRIEKSAAQLGITVSAYLRRCALSAVAHNPSPDPPAAPAPVKARRASRQSPPPPPAVYAPPAPTLFGGWLALLRNRFLGPPIRFSEDA